MLEHYLELDREVLLAINGANSPIADSIMTFLSAIPVWIPLYIAIAALFFYPKWFSRRSFIRRERRFVPSWLIGIVSVVAVVICFGLTDQLSVLIKGIVQRPRPCAEPLLEGIVRFWEEVGPNYGFVSSHACNTFGLAILSSMIVKRWGFSIFMVLWAFAVSYSRVYLAKHYPLDILCGAILGIVIAIVVYLIWETVISSLDNKYLKHLSA